MGLALVSPRWLERCNDVDVASSPLMRYVWPAQWGHGFHVSSGAAYCNAKVEGTTTPRGCRLVYEATKSWFSDMGLLHLEAALKLALQGEWFKLTGHTFSNLGRGNLMGSWPMRANDSCQPLP